MKYYFSFIALFATLTCGANAVNYNFIPMEQDTIVQYNQLAERLERLQYHMLFSGGDSLWANEKNRALLLQIITDSNPNLGKARFFAAEILFARFPEFPAEELKPTLAYIYGQAIQHTNNWLPGNEWGFLSYPGMRGGTAGSHLVRIGKEALPYLYDLTSPKNNGPIVYIGSEEATIGVQLHYRTKDLAAYYLSKIYPIPTKYYETNKERDIEIERIRSLYALSTNFDSALEIKAFFNEDIYYQIGGIISKGWKISYSASAATFTITTDLPKGICHNNAGKLEQPSFTEMPYQLSFSFTSKHPLNQKMPVSDRSPQATHVTVISETPKIVLSETQHLIQSVPDCQTRDYNVFISHNLPKHSDVCDCTTKSEIQDLKEKIKVMLNQL